MPPKKQSTKAVASAEQPHGYEFFGPPGAVVISLGLPLVCYGLTFLCNDISGCPAPSTLHPSTLTLDKLKQEVGWPKNGIQGLASWRATGWVLGYYLLSLTLQAFLPGEEAEGLTLKTGGKLKYKFNAFNSAVLTFLGLGVGTLLQGTQFPVWPFIWNNYLQIITANLFVAFASACFVYVRSFSVKPNDKDHRVLAAGGHSGNLIYDWFIGRELNPRVDLPIFGTIDIKIFYEMRPGLLGWIILDLAYAVKQYKTYGTLSDSMIMTCAFQTLYMMDGLYMEPAILTTMDVTTDGFGFMLAFGDLVWVPIIYSLQARYLSVYPVNLGLTGILAILTVQGVGYYIFRSANNEKNRFRNNPEDPRVAHLESIETASGSKLLVTGWWGTARHVNYCGDWIMGWSYCMPTGIAGYLIQKDSLIKGDDGNFTRISQGEARGWGMLVTYFYIIYFAVLLIHRERRDEVKCERKYGKDWAEYKKRVPYRIIPYVY